MQMASLRVGMVALGLVALTASVPVKGAFAQETTSDINSKKVTLNLENADIRYALKLLFQSVGANYQLDQGVQGTVTVSLTDVSFRTALESILRGTASTLPLTYRVESGVYNIAPKEEVKTDTTTAAEDIVPAKPSTRPQKITLQYADAMAIAMAFGGGVIQGSSMSGFGSGMGGGMGGMGGGMGGMGGGMGGMGGGMGGMGGGMGGMGGGMGGFGGGGMGGGGGGGRRGG